MSLGGNLLELLQGNSSSGFVLDFTQSMLGAFGLEDPLDCAKSFCELLLLLSNDLPLMYALP